MSAIIGSIIPGKTYSLKFTEQVNKTMIVSSWSSEASMGDKKSQAEAYDSIGALFYVIAVIAMFGCTIIMMFCSFVRKSRQDNSIVSYMKDVQRLEKLQLTQEKFRTKLKIHHKKVHRILGPDRAEIITEMSSVSGPPSPVQDGGGEQLMNAWNSRRQLELPDDGRQTSSWTSLGTIIVSDKDLEEEEERYRRQQHSQHRRLSAPVTNIALLNSEFDKGGLFCGAASLGGSRGDQRAASCHFSTVPEVRVQTCE